MRAAFLATMLTLPAVAAADPLVVHTATPPNGQGITTAQRVGLADAVAEVLAAGQPEVLRASETHARVETLAPASLACDAADCAASVATALHARGVVLVSVARDRRRQVTLTLRWIDEHGAVGNEQRAQEVCAEWDDAIALARVSARALLAAMRAPAPAAPTAPLALATPVVAAPLAAPLPPTAPPRTQRVSRRRVWEAALGGALIAGGGAMLGIGAVAVAQDGEATSRVVANGSEVYTATGRDTALLIAGGVVAAGGIFLLVDGLRARSVEVPVTPQAMAIPGGAWVGVGGAL